VIPPAAIIAVSVAIPIGIVAALAVADKRRREALQQYGEQRGYRFERKRRSAEQALADEFPIFQRGHGRSWGCTITGQVGGKPFTAFEYVYVTGGGRSSHRHPLAMMLWEAPEVRLPRFSCVPEGFWNRLVQRFGKQDFDFEGDEEFSRGYELQGDDEAGVRALFTQTRRAHLVATGPEGTAPRHHLAGAGNRLLWWRTGRLPGPDEMDQFIADGDRMRRLFMEERG
jgi:hypothetical protein